MGMLSHGIEKLARHCSISERCAMCSRESDLAILIHGSSCAQALRNVDKSAGLPSKSPKGCWDLVNIVTAKIHKHSETMKPGTKNKAKKNLRQSSSVRAPLKLVLRVVEKFSASRQKDLEAHWGSLTMSLCIGFNPVSAVNVPSSF